MESDRFVAQCPEEFFASHPDFKLRVLSRESEEVGFRHYIDTGRVLFSYHVMKALSQVEADPGSDWIYLSLRKNLDETMLINRAVIPVGAYAVSVITNEPSLGIVQPGYESYNIGIRKDFLLSKQEFTSKQFTIPSAPTIFHVDKTLFNYCIEQFAEMNSGSLSADELEALAIKLCFVLLPNLDEAHRLVPSNRHRIVYASINHIRQHPMRKISPSELARISHCSLRTLQYAFKRTLGLSPKQYNDRFRLSVFRTALLESDSHSKKKIQDLAQQFGFSHAGNLSRSYKELYGRLPSDGCPCEVHEEAEGVDTASESASAVSE